MYKPEVEEQLDEIIDRREKEEQIKTIMTRLEQLEAVAKDHNIELNEKLDRLLHDKHNHKL